MPRTKKLPDMKFKKGLTKELDQVLRSMEILESGFLCECCMCDAMVIIEHMVVNHDWEYGEGRMGEGLYTPNWDQIMGEWCIHETFVIQPKVVYDYLLQE